MMSQHQRQHHQQQVQQHHQIVQGRYKSCDSCAKRRKRCDGLLPRCSPCIVRNQPHCHYRTKKPSESQLKAIEAYREGVFSGSKRPATTTRDAVVTSRGLGASSLLDLVSLKRYRLSPSPATGFVGMQENAFLNDFFGCLGFFPLASRRMVRQAMVEIMLCSAPSEGQQRPCVGTGSLSGEEGGRSLQQGHDWGWGQTPAERGGTGNPSKCILWCAIAVGALMQGCPLEFVEGYLKRAQESLADCCSETTVETARAYLAMAVLHKLLGDQDNNRTHLALVCKILEGFPPDIVPTDMLSMLQTEGFDSNLFRQGTRVSGVHDKPKEQLEDTDRIPELKEAMHDGDLSNILFLADRRLRKAIFDDMCVQSAIACASKGEGTWQPGGSDGAPAALPFEGEHEELGKFRNGEGLRPPLSLGSTVEKEIVSRSVRDTRAAGEGTKAFITNVYPQLSRLSGAMERSGMFSGMGGFFYHSTMAYMDLIRGDMHSGFQSIKACARVIIRFPGICRYRPHTVHSVLTVVASSKCRDVYDPLRKIYNLILPKDGTPAPPLEEWHEGPSICEALFCRSLQVELNRVGFGPSRATGTNEEDTGACAPRVSSSEVCNSTTTAQDTRWSSDSLAQGAQYMESAAVSGGVGNGPLLYADQVPLPCPIRTITPPQRGVIVAAGRGGQLGVEEAGAIASTSPRNEQLCHGSEQHRAAGFASAEDDRLGAPTLDYFSEELDTDSARGSMSGNIEERRPQTTIARGMASSDMTGKLLGDNIRLDHGVGVSESPGVADNVAVVGNTPEYDFGFLGGEWDGVDLRLTDEDLMSAEEVLMSSGLDGEELW